MMLKEVFVEKEAETVLARVQSRSDEAYYRGRLVHPPSGPRSGHQPERPSTLEETVWGRPFPRLSWSRSSEAGTRKISKLRLENTRRRQERGSAKTLIS